MEYRRLLAGIPLIKVYRSLLFPVSEEATRVERYSHRTHKPM